MDSGVYITKVANVECDDGTQTQLPIEAFIVCAESNYVIFSRMLFPPQITAQLMDAGVEADHVMLDLNCN